MEMLSLINISFAFTNARKFYFVQYCDHSYQQYNAYLQFAKRVDL